MKYRTLFSGYNKVHSARGGLFTWIELPVGISAREVLVRSLEKKIAFVPGGSFYPNGNKENTLRINYSNMPEEKIEKG